MRHAHPFDLFLWPCSDATTSCKRRVSLLAALLAFDSQQPYHHPAHSTIAPLSPAAAVPLHPSIGGHFIAASSTLVTTLVPLTTKDWLHLPPTFAAGRRSTAPTLTAVIAAWPAASQHASLSWPSKNAEA